MTTLTELVARLIRRLGAPALDPALAAYLDWLQDELKHLPIIPIKSSERQERLLLEDVYVPLRVVERAQIEGFRKLTLGDFDPGGEYRLRQEAFDALERSQRVYRLLSDPDQLPSPPADGRPSRRRSTEVPEILTTRLLLVGDAGSGKTTTLQFGALALAHDLEQSTTASAQQLLDLHCARPPLPFYIRLTLVATALREVRERARHDPFANQSSAPSKLLLAWLDSYISTQIGKSGRQVPTGLPSQQIAAGGCLVLLDGLDETGDAAEREYMQRLILDLAQDYPGNRYLVASRPFADLRLPGFEQRYLSPLNSEEMQRLLRNWFNAVRKSDSPRLNIQSAEEQIAYLWNILEQNARLFEMATNPLLLTSIALLVHTGVGLPRERAELYSRLVYLLLETWRVLQISDGALAREERRPALYGGGESVSGVQRRLQDLAAWMQEQQRREIRLSEAQQLLSPVYRQQMAWSLEQSDDYIHRLLESLALESGMIQRRDGGYSFTHYTLQEYLTARAYDQRSHSVDSLFAHWSQPRWRETILLAVGHWATSGDPEKAQRLLRKLLDTGDAAAVILAGEALADADATRVPELAPLRVETAGRLRAIAFEPTSCPDPPTRNRAASLLDRLDADERPGLDLEDGAYWAAPIPPGPFVMGDDNGEYDDEKPAFTCTIGRPYALARYPVTNRQYLRFLEALEASGRAEEAERRRPRLWPGRRYRAGEGSHPVVAVSWEDATAFAAWVDHMLREQGVLKEGEQVRLPAELEWERAAAYPVALSVDDNGASRREYPWGEWPTGHLTATTNGGINAGIPANIGESGIGGTSVAGIFPHGTAACGAEDMAGNVWEWCSTPYIPYEELKQQGGVEPETLYSLSKKGGGRTYVLRGGSWADARSDARCACRDSDLPPHFVGDVGLRLARLFSFT